MRQTCHYFRSRCNLFFYAALSLRAQGIRCDNFPSRSQFVLDGDTESLSANSTHAVGHLVIVPEMSFTCYGYITGWSAVTQLSDTVVNNQSLDNLVRDITFQLWRPTDKDSVYSFVGSNVLNFIGPSLRSVLTVVNDTHYLNFSDVAPSGDDMLVFQPGDVIGWYIHSSLQSLERPLSVVYRRSDDPQSVGMYSTVIADTARADTEPPCDLSLHIDHTKVISSVIPYVSIHYSTSKPLNLPTVMLVHILFLPHSISE